MTLSDISYGVVKGKYIHRECRRERKGTNQGRYSKAERNRPSLFLGIHKSTAFLK